MKTHSKLEYENEKLKKENKLLNKKNNWKNQNPKLFTIKITKNKNKQQLD